MEQPFSSSKVTVEYSDPYDVYKLLAPGLIPRLPLRDLNWQSHAGPLRSISTLHTELVPAGVDYSAIFTPQASPNPKIPAPPDTGAATSRDDGFQPAAIGARAGSSEQQAEPIGGTLRPPAGGAAKERRHQIPGLRRTPYLKVLLVRCDDNDTYKSTTRAEIREWIKNNTAGSPGKTGSNAENHDAFEWLIVHVVLPNSTAATQPRVSGKAPDSSSDSKTTSRWRGGSSTLLEKLRADFNGSTKGAVDRVCQIRIGINDVPYNMLPRVVPAVPTGYTETEQDAEKAWADLIAKFKELILLSFDRRVTQYEEDIKERDAQRSLPGWNFCTFFILKEGLARGFESVGLVEDALVIYDQLSVGLDNIIQEQTVAGSAEAHGGALLSYTEELKERAQKAMAEIAGGQLEFEESEAVDLQVGDKKRLENDSIPISSSKKPYRDLILANKVSLLDFRCYIFARQITLLLRLANAWSSREELLAKLKEQQELVPKGVAPRTPAPKMTEEPENLWHLAEICKRTLEFVPAVSSVMRADIVAAMASVVKGEGAEADPNVSLDPLLSEVIDNMVASFAFSVAQQILAQTSTKALPIPPSTLGTPEAEQKVSIPEPKTMMHPARSSSLRSQSPQAAPRSPIGFPGPSRADDVPAPPYLKAGLEELAAQRAGLCALSRNILEGCGKKRGWTDGWASVPTVGEPDINDMEEVSLDDNDEKAKSKSEITERLQSSVAGVDNALLRTALDNKDDFYRLYETLVDKALRHYTVANHTHAVQANMADLAVLKFHLGEFKEAAFYFYRVIPFYGENGWSLLELSMLVMYARCLKELKRLDDYVNKALRQLLCKAAAAERDRRQQRSQFRLGLTSTTQYPEPSAISGFLADLLEVSGSLDKEVKIPLTSLFCDMGLDGPPFYDDDQDSFSLFFDLHSLLVDEFEATSVSLRISSLSGAAKEIWLQSKGPLTIRPGPNKVKVQSTVMMAGAFEVDQVRLESNKVLLHYERDIRQPVDKAMAVLKNPRINLYQRTNCLDVQLLAARDLQLDKKKSLDLEISTGWNDITSCEVKIKSATGGLRLVMSEAEVIGSPQPTASQGGTFTFGPMRPNTSLKLRFPFTVEIDVLDVAVRAEVTYTTAKGTFTFFKASSVPISLALEVNVQDIFKHEALFSRFSVSTASDSPLRLLKSELHSSDLFESHFGQPSSHPIVVYPKQPASLLYKITRKPGSTLGPKVKKTLYLKLYYTVVQDEIEFLFKQALTTALEPTPLKEFSKVVVSKVLSAVKNGLSADDLEQATLLGELPTSFLSNINWEQQLPSLSPGSIENDTTGTASLPTFLRTWLRAHPTLPLPQPSSAGPSPGNVNTILIPVDVPPVSVVHTADIRLQQPLPTVVASGNSESGGFDDQGYPTVLVNQLLPATLHLKWTRIWDSADGATLAPAATPTSPSAGVVGAGGGGAAARDRDLEFEYEIVAASDTWLVGGRRKGHFVIPAVDSSLAGAGTDADADGGDVVGLSSTPETEAEIPVVLIPLREGYLPFPGVEIREVDGGGAEGDGDGGSGGEGKFVGYGQCETDFKNLGETVRVVADRGKVTVSLDASGTSGGPLVLECEGWATNASRVVV
ncbi:trafficking protein particle complex subunit 10 [Corynascus novoguineensis]|uniref:Trafficking protein particle complex subunit 10 n=1 Tax=Corynascus novoguineensis TaxID=1126955 RepID=A0AAN7CSM4_9PEZI|nr:trafficking protein particle complex subunit 10 [Corynascus novoguineensis]